VTNNLVPVLIDSSLNIGRLILPDTTKTICVKLEDKIILEELDKAQIFISIDMEKHRDSSDLFDASITLQRLKEYIIELNGIDLKAVYK